MTSEQLDKLKKANYKDVPFFDLNGYQTWAKCVHIYDGDTCTLAFYYGNQIYKFKVRLAEIDTAEKNSSNKNEAEWALKAKVRLQELIDDTNNGLIYIKCYKWDKYGRLLAYLYKNDHDEQVSFNEILIKEGYAYAYDGGGKKPFEQWTPTTKF